MNPGRLYLKIFLSFLAVLIVTEILVFSMFLLSARRVFQSHLVQNVGSKMLVARDYMQETIDRTPGMDQAAGKPLQSLIDRLAKIYDADVWLTGPTGTVLVKSFQGDVPAGVEDIAAREGKLPKRRGFFSDFSREEDFGAYKLYHRFGRNSVSYAVIPLRIGSGGTGDLHVLFNNRKWERISPEAKFALELLAIGVVIALLIIPVSRLITKPIDRLKNSALHIAGGDLSYRADVTGKDEIGELGRSFNHMADKLERMIRGGRELTANISHELRSPLARIRIAEELLRECIDRDDYGECASHLNAIQEDIEEMDRLIGRILVLSKLDIHEQPLKRERFDLRGLMHDLLERFKPAMERSRLAVTEDLSFDAPFSGDREALAGALSNILDNVVKFATPGGDVLVDMHSEPGGVEIGVANPCIPLAEGDLAGIFEPFYRANDSPARGSGLGLAITRKIIEKHGGSIHAVGLAEGLKIRIFLPV